MLSISGRKKSDRKSIQSQTLYLGNVISAVVTPACENPYLPFKIFGFSTNMLDLTVVKAVHPKVLLTVTNLNLLAKLYFVNLTFLLSLELTMRNSYFSGLHVNMVSKDIMVYTTIQFCVTECGCSFEKAVPSLTLSIYNV